MRVKKKKLVLLIPQMVHGGAERVVSRLSLMLTDIYDIKIIVFNNTVPSYKVGCEIIHLGKNINTDKKVLNFFRYLKTIYLYKKYKRKNNIDITYSFGDKANLVNIFSCGKDKKIISIRGYRRIRTGSGIKEKYILKPLSKLICNKADSIVSVSELMSKTIEKEYGVPLSKIKTSYNGYDIENIVNSSMEEIPNELFEKIGSNRIIITAGTLRREKGYWHLLKAFSIVLKKTKNVKLLILGEDYLGNKQKIESLAKELGIIENIIFAGYQSNPFKYFSRSTIYVLSSISEGFPNALLEAMACRLPIVSTDCKSGPREILSPNTNMFSSTKHIEFSDFGVLVEQMNEKENYDNEVLEDCDKSLAEAILSLLENEDLREKYALKSFKRACDFGHVEWLKKQEEIISN